MTDTSKEVMIAAMRRSLLMMELAGIPKAQLAEVLEMVLKELRAELEREKKH